MDPFGENDIFAEIDVCVSDVTEWEMWDVLRQHYMPSKIPNNIQLQCYKRQEVAEGKMIFYSFTCMGEINEWLQQRSHIFPDEFNVCEYCSDPQEFCLTTEVSKSLIDSIHSIEDVIYFAYDPKLERFLMFVTEMDIARGIHETIQTHIRDCMPYLVLQAFQEHLLEEHQRKEAEIAMVPQYEVETRVGTATKVPHTPRSFCSYVCSFFGCYAESLL